MSTLAIVLGIGFLSGVLTFSSGLSTTFDGIIDGSTSEAVVRPAGTASFEAVGAGNTQTLDPDDVAALAALPEVALADGSVDGLGLYVLDPDRKLVGTGGAPTLSFNYTDTPNMAGQPILALDDGRWPEAVDEIALDTTAAANAGYEVGDRVTVIPPGRRRQRPGHRRARAGGRGRLQRRRRHRRRHPGDLLDRGRPGDVPRRRRRLHLGAADRRRRGQPAAAGRGRRAGAAGRLRGGHGRRRRRGVEVGGRGVPRLHRHLPGRLRGDRGASSAGSSSPTPSRSWSPSAPASSRCCAAWAPAARRYAARCCSRPRSPPSIGASARPAAGPGPGPRPGRRCSTASASRSTARC